MAEAKVYIAIPTCRSWKPQFGVSMCDLVRQTVKAGIEFEINAMVGASILPKARELALRHAVQHGFSHILFLDDDMKFHGDLLKEFLAENLDVVAVNYTNKNPAKPSAMTHGLDGQVVESRDRIGTMEVGWIGFGAVLIRLDAVKHLPTPLFEMSWLPERQDYIGEDYFFCKKVREAGVRIYISHDASQHIGHVGDFVFRETA